MQFSQTIAVLAILAGSALAAPQPNTELSKRTCFGLTGTPLTVCQDACKATCAAATAGLAKSLCEKACDAGSVKRDIEVRDDAAAPSTSTTAASVTPAVQVTDINAVSFPKVDASVGTDACKAACAVTCNSTVLALIQSACVKKCESLC